jgi:spore coat polysaccharide biosynthesis protein SpsF
MILAILQARVSSSRLPGTVLKPLIGEPMLKRQIERVRRARLLDGLVVATSNDSSDDPIDALCQEIQVSCFRGSLSDVLDRYHQAAKRYLIKDVVRLTGDCPLADPEVIDQVISTYIKSGADYASNTLEPTYPDGLDVEVFSFAALERAWLEAKLPSQREHVTPFIHCNPHLFRLASVRQATDLSAQRWTVDNLEDYEFVCRIYEALYPSNPTFTTHDILKLLEQRPELKQINMHIKRNEGLTKSLSEDMTILDNKEQH